eukprot:6702963-Pyramimonas_sp.AAC.1
MHSTEPFPALQGGRESASHRLSAVHSLRKGMAGDSCTRSCQAGAVAGYEMCHITLSRLRVAIM